MKRLLKRILGPSEEKIEAMIQECLREGLIELIGMDHGDPIYRTTEKGLKLLEDLKKQRR